MSVTATDVEKKVLAMNVNESFSIFNDSQAFCIARTSRSRYKMLIVFSYGGHDEHFTSSNAVIKRVYDLMKEA